jgi:hypothetical protein
MSRTIPYLACLASLALAAGLSAAACSSGQTADCSDAQCGVLPDGAGFTPGDDTSDDASDSASPTPETGANQEAGSTPVDSGGSDAVDDATGSDAHTDAHADAAADGGDSGSRDAAEGG